jgi:ATP-dependent protease ClpP protease subunit
MVEPITDATALRFKQFVDKAIEDNVQIIDIKLETDGGSVVAGQSIVSDMIRFQGWINVVVSGRAVSMGGVLACYADGLIKDDNAVFLYHTLRISIQTPLGPMTKLLKEDNVNEPVLKAQYEMFRTLLKACDQFLTDKQRQDILNGEDVVIFGKDLKEYKEPIKASPFNQIDGGK